MDKILSSLSVSAALSASLLMPLSAFAYLTPDQVFGGSSGTSHGAAGDELPPPPTMREGEDRVAEQQQRAAAERAAAQQELQPVDAAPEVVDTYVPDDTPESKGLFDEAAQYEKRQERIEDERSSGPTIIIGGDTVVTDANGNVLHSGAPRISATGPESVLAVAAMLLAGLCTFGYMQYRSHRVFAAA